MVFGHQRARIDVGCLFVSPCCRDAWRCGSTCSRPVLMHRLYRHLSTSNREVRRSQSVVYISLVNLPKRQLSVRGCVGLQIFVTGFSTEIPHQIFTKLPHCQGCFVHELMSQGYKAILWRKWPYRKTHRLWLYSSGSGSFYGLRCIIVWP